MGEWLLPRCSKEAVDILFLDTVIFRVEFTLDCVELIGALSLSNKIDTVSLAFSPCSFAQSAYVQT